MSWVFLSVAILSEVIATVFLKIATDSRRKVFYGIVGIGYIVAFAFLSASLYVGMQLAVAYGVWTAGGVVLTAIASCLFFKEKITINMVFGIFLISVGVFLIEVSGNFH